MHLSLKYLLIKSEFCICRQKKVISKLTFFIDSEHLQLLKWDEIDLLLSFFFKIYINLVMRPIMLIQRNPLCKDALDNKCKIRYRVNSSHDTGKRKGELNYE